MKKAPGKILLVDDNPTNIDVLYNFLADVGYEVLIAEDGMSALERVSLVSPDLILLDVMMPHIDGFEVCRKLQENPETKEIPVIFITALGSVEDKITGFKTGGVDYVTKPFQNDEILARIRNHLELRDMRKSLEIQNDQLRTQNEALDAYARTVAHDLKNPLNLILNFAKFIQDEDILTGVPKDDLGRIVDSAEQMNHIIQDLLLLAQLRKEDVHMVQVNMDAVIRHSLDRLHLEIKKHHVDLEMPTSWPDAIGISSWVQAVWVNYISNAIKYGGEPRKVKLSWEKVAHQPGTIRYRVEDNGVGVPPEHQAKIFDEFTRVGGERSEGHGIGLSIVRRIIHRLGGEVEVSASENGIGSCFSFTLKQA
ncbi:hybrid sensor histidine kinase/response regulator [Kiritimatiellaeota bacterium B1221]|nr:hybrid sensor histidine kinase/response regulator [Kiritimatiellaeota bacterium B1221]